MNYPAMMIRAWEYQNNVSEYNRIMCKSSSMGITHSKAFSSIFPSFKTSIRFPFWPLKKKTDNHRWTQSQMKKKIATITSSVLDFSMTGSKWARWTQKLLPKFRVLGGSQCQLEKNLKFELKLTKINRISRRSTSRYSKLDFCVPYGYQCLNSWQTWEQKG